MHLIASGCKKDVENFREYDFSSKDCPFVGVRDRKQPFKIIREGDTIPSPEKRIPESILNDLCQECDEWDPIHEKPEQDILSACDLPGILECPEEKVRRALRGYVENGLDERCGPCRLFTPKK